MKNKLGIAAAMIISISLFISCSYRRHHPHNLNVRISESGNTYTLKAEYNEDKTGAVQRYINRQVKPNSFFESPEDYFSMNAELNDRTKFYIKSAPGKLLIKLNKKQNTYAAYARVRNMCEGVARIVKDN